MFPASSKGLLPKSPEQPAAVSQEPAAANNEASVKLRDVAVIVGDVIENVIVVADDSQGEAFLQSEYAPRGRLEVDGARIDVPAIFVDVTDLEPGKRPGPGWTVGAAQKSELADAIKDIVEKGSTEKAEACAAKYGKGAVQKPEAWAFEAPAEAKPPK